MRLAPYVRSVKTSSEATALQIVYSNRRGAQKVEHLGSAHTEAEVAPVEGGRAAEA